MNTYELRISSDLRSLLDYQDPLFLTLTSALELHQEADIFADVMNKTVQEKSTPSAQLYSLAVLHAAYHDVIDYYLENVDSSFLHELSVSIKNSQHTKSSIEVYNRAYPSIIKPFLKNKDLARSLFVHSIIDTNEAVHEALGPLFKSKKFSYNSIQKEFTHLISLALKKVGKLEWTKGELNDLYDFLTGPQKKFPGSLKEQLEFILKNWGLYLSDRVKGLLIKALAYIKESERMFFSGSGKARFGISDLEGKEAYTPDKDWMPNVVMLAKNTLVWLSQLSDKYKRDISRVDQIPDEELDFLKESGFTALWLIGMWQRSPASKKIKQLCGNYDAESSAYSLYSYTISDRLGGEWAMDNLRSRLWQRGIRLATDMVPNHTGIDSPWVMERPDYFISQTYSPFASYSFNGADLSSNPDIEIKIEDHYYSKTDCAVTFLRRDKRTGDTRFIFHGNDGTSMPWNDTAQLDYLNPDVRQAVSDVIVDIARKYPIIRFDAAMTLATRHIRRLWYPDVGNAGDIPGRTDHAIDDETFASRLGEEFWKTVVDRVQREVPDTLLLAEAFWMMEGYFVRSLGLHRVYNSAFMNMLRDENNKEYRDGMKQTLLFDPEIMQRYVNFLNNPDENAAVEGFGDTDKYFGCCTLLATLPGLPMFGHGQIEGFREKYGMEFTRPKWNEEPNQGLIDGHKYLIFPLLKKRRCFSGFASFELFDFVNEHNSVEENVYAYANGYGDDRVFVFYNNSYSASHGRVKDSVQKNVKNDKGEKHLVNTSIAAALGINVASNTFMKWQTLKDKHWHIYPSELLKNEGFWLHLNGFETQVFQNISTVVDYTGVYKRYWDAYGIKGSLNIEEEAEDLLFSSIYKRAGALLDKDYLSAVENALSKESSKSIKTIIDTLTSAYKDMQKGFEESAINAEFTIPAEDDIRRIFSNLHKTKKKMPGFIEASLSVIDHKNEMFYALLFLLPFLSNFKGEETALGSLLIRAAVRFYAFLYKDKALLDDPIAIKRAEKQLFILLNSRNWQITLKEILQNKQFYVLIDVNTYDNVDWYNKEFYHEAVFFSTFSHIIFDKIEDKDIVSLIDFAQNAFKCAENSLYQFKKLYDSAILVGGKDEV